MTEKSIFAKNMQKLRIFYGWSQEATARKLNIKRGTLAAYEEGRACPQLPLFFQICELYKIKDAAGFVLNPDFDIHADFVRPNIRSDIKKYREKIADLESAVQTLETKASKALSILQT